MRRKLAALLLAASRTTNALRVPGALGAAAERLGRCGGRAGELARDATVYAIVFSPTGDLLSTGGGDKQATPRTMSVPPRRHISSATGSSPPWLTNTHGSLITTRT